MTDVQEFQAFFQRMGVPMEQNVWDFFVPDYESTCLLFRFSQDGEYLGLHTEDGGWFPRQQTKE